MTKQDSISKFYYPNIRITSIFAGPKKTQYVILTPTIKSSNQKCRSGIILKFKLKLPTRSKILIHKIKIKSLLI